jgi:hypothetical protein
MSQARDARLATAGCVLLAAVLVLAACGGKSGSSAGASNTSPTTSTAPAGQGGQSGGNGGRFGSALAAFRDCMSSHGITLPTRPRNGNRTPPSTTPGETFPPPGAGGGGGGGFGFGFGNFADRFNTPPAGVDPTEYKAALTACRSKLPTGNGFADNSAFQAYRSCLQDHGVTLPSSGSAGSASGINRNDPKVQAALKTCAPLLPAGFGRRGGTGSSTTTTTVPA